VDSNSPSKLQEIAFRLKENEARSAGRLHGRRKFAGSLVRRSFVHIFKFKSFAKIFNLPQDKLSGSKTNRVLSQRCEQKFSR
jgi:hypothetical protein